MSETRKTDIPLYDFRCDEGHRFERVVPLVAFDDQQHCDCGSPACRMVSAPALRSDAIEPRRGADGRMHDSLQSYQHSLTPEGNVKGERYLEMGDAELKHAPKDFDRAQRREDIKKAIADVQNGRVAPLGATA